MIEVLILLVVGAGVYFLVKRIRANRSDFIECPRCEGKGFWYDGRGKEKCDWCDGSGLLPKEAKGLQ